MIIGIDLGGTNIKTGIFDDKLHRIAENWGPTESETDSQTVINNIFKCVEGLLKKANASVKQVEFIGMGIPGLMDIKKGLSVSSPNFQNWQNVEIVKMFEQKYSVPVFIDNDVRVNLYGELWARHLEKHPEINNVFLVTLGTGLGAALYLDGHVVHGKTFSAGEFGHMNMVRSGGRPCNCGSSGCLARYVSGRGIVVTAKNLLVNYPDSILSQSSEFTAKDISAAYDKGDQLAVETYKRTGQMFGFGLGNVINLLNPDLIIIGGGMAKAKDRLMKYAKETVNHHAMGIPVRHTKFEYAKLGQKAGMVGAVIMAKEQKNF